MDGTEIIMTADPGAAMDRLAPRHPGRRWFVLTDSTVERAQAPLFGGSRVLAQAPRLAVEPGDGNKTPAALLQVWQWLSDAGAVRSSALVCAGGGMVTDLGGMAAATFKRGIPCVNIPTTLLGAVDAAVGGKTGVNLGALKNEVGVFAMPEAVIMSSAPFSTLPRTELLSGYAEMLKTGFISSGRLYRDLAPVDRVLDDPERLRELMGRCVDVKRDITARDPHEAGLRKTLNFGHTAGHAFESLARSAGRPLPHGVAVAYGMVTALVLSHMKLGLEASVLHGYVSRVLTPFFPRFCFKCSDRDRLVALMGHDKKNTAAGQPLFVLLRTTGDPVWDIPVSPDDLGAALDITADLTSC